MRHLPLRLKEHAPDSPLPFTVIAGGLSGGEGLNESQLKTLCSQLYDYLTRLDLNTCSAVCTVGNKKSVELYLKLPGESAALDLYIKVTKYVEKGHSQSGENVSYTFNLYADSENGSAHAISLTGSELDLKQAKPIEKVLDRLRDLLPGDALNFTQPFELLEAETYVKKTMVEPERRRIQGRAESAIK